MIYFKEGLVIHERLNKEEARVFILFLTAEMERHKDDISKIERTIEYLENKFELKHG